MLVWVLEMRPVDGRGGAFSLRLSLRLWLWACGKIELAFDDVRTRVRDRERDERGESSFPGSLPSPEPYVVLLFGLTNLEKKLGGIVERVVRLRCVLCVCVFVCLRSETGTGTGEVRV